MSDDEPTVPIVCPACETTSRVPIDDVADTVEGHNERHHDGEAIAEVDPALKDQLADLVVDDLGLLEDES
ncbi:hypothetical protein [Halovivax cerinus]|uniref:DUF8149 domain-containing protein n=1 Tax=Halovivax cerinus TaxID=1487865 RepID=A0ABD5NT50_9EURY|nr:hypothetical protein [Halovivax cerinus]